MPPTEKSSSQQRTPAGSQAGQLRPAGVPVYGDRPETSAVRAFDELAPKARQMCGNGAPVIFTAVDWGLPRVVGEDVEQVFTVHTGHRVAIRLAREKAARLFEALGLTLADAGIIEAPSIAKPNGKIL